MAKDDDHMSDHHPGTKAYALGIGCILLSGLFLAIIGAFAKLISARLSVECVAFYQFVIATLLVAPFIFQKKLVKTKHPYLHLIRDIAGFFTFYLLYLSLSSITLIDAIVLNTTAPLFVPLVIWAWFRRPIHLGLSIALIIGFIGVVLILHPEGKDFLKAGAILALLSGLFGAIGFVTIRKMILSEKPITISFYYFAVCTVLFAILISLFYTWQWPIGNEWWAIIGMGVALPLMQHFLAKSTHYVPAARVIPYFYSTIIFSGLLGWWLWQEIPSWLSIIGMVLVVIGAVLSVFMGKKRTHHET